MHSISGPTRLAGAESRYVKGNVPCPSHGTRNIRRLMTAHSVNDALDAPILPARTWSPKRTDDRTATLIEECPGSLARETARESGDGDAVPQSL
jgi:hypothetical protein